MSSINKILGGLFPHREPKEDEYINEADGLIYCAKCHTPRQCVIQHGDRIVTPPVMCNCQRTAAEKAEAAFQKRQEEFRIERMKANGLQDRYLHDYTFANDKGYNPEIKKAQRYVTEWAMMKENCIGLLLWGNVGTGKDCCYGDLSFGSKSCQSRLRAKRSCSRRIYELLGNL